VPTNLQGNTVSADNTNRSPKPKKQAQDGKRQGTFASIVRIYPWAKPAMPRIYLGMVSALIAALVALLIPQVLRSLVDGPLQDGDSSQIWWPVGAVLGLGVLEAVMIWFRRWFVLQPGTHVEADLRNSLYKQLQDLPVNFHDRWASGQLLSRAVSDLNLVRRWISFGIVLLVVNTITILIGFIFLLSISWILGLVFVVCSIPLWIYGYLFEQKYSVVARRSQDQAGDLATAVEESVHGIRIAGIWLWLLMVPDVTFGLCLLGGVWLAGAGEISVGQLVAFFATATVLRFPVESIGFLLSMTFDTRTAADRFFEVMDAKNTIVDPEHPKTIAHPEGRLVFDDVHFRYSDSPSQYDDLLDGIDLELEPGETMAVVGLTGSGKSTLTALTTRLYDVTGGAIRLDGVDIRDLGRIDLRTHIAMAFEDATLFSASVRENVMLGRPEGSDADLAEALDIAQADFVYDLPFGIDTRVGEEGLSLSGGQRQRLALARAVAARPEVLVLDDPLSALDVDTEALVEAALRRVLASTTALIVAHRPSTVMLADRVALLERGRITAVGRHSDLLESSDHYRFVISSLEDEEKREAQEVNA